MSIEDEKSKVVCTPLSDVETHFIRRGTRYPAENLV